MSLDRTIIRTDLVSRLAGKTSVGLRVFDWRTEPLFDQDLPAIVVKVLDERAVSKSAGAEPRMQSVLTLQLEIHAYGSQSKAVADQLDQINDEIEAAILRSSTWIQQFEKLDGYETRIDLQTESDKVRGTAIILWDVVYQRVFEPAVIDDFTTLKIDVDAIDPADPNIHAPDGTWPDGYGGQPGPDNRIEVAATLTLEQDL